MKKSEFRGGSDEFTAASGRALIDKFLHIATATVADIKIRLWNAKYRNTGLDLIEVYNNGAENFKLCNYVGTQQVVLAPGELARCSLVDNTTTAGVWIIVVDNPDAPVPILHETGFVFGGGSAQTEDRLELYNAGSNTWTQKADLPEARQRGCGFVLTTFGYAIGGIAGGGAEVSVDRYSPSGDAWIGRTDSPIDLQTSPGGASADGKGYVFAGSLSDNRKVAEYQSNAWTAKTARPTGSAQVVAATPDSSNIYVLGVDAHWIYSSDLWLSRAARPPASHEWRDTAYAASGGKLYAFMGKALPSYYDEVDEYDPGTNVWTSKADFPLGNRNNGAAFTIDGHIYYAGGNQSGTPKSDVYRYTPGTNTWTARASYPLNVDQVNEHGMTIQTS